MRNQKVANFCIIVILVVSNHGYVTMTSLPEEELTITDFTYWQRYMMTISLNVFYFYLIEKFFRGERLELMKQCFETDLVRQEYHTILENMNEGVLTKSSGIKHFNTVMLDLLKQSECLSEEQEALLHKFNDQISSFKDMALD